MLYLNSMNYTGLGTIVCMWTRVGLGVSVAALYPTALQDLYRNFNIFKLHICFGVWLRQ